MLELAVSSCHNCIISCWTLWQEKENHKNQSKIPHLHRPHSLYVTGWHGIKNSIKTSENLIQWAHTCVFIEVRLKEIVHILYLYLGQVLDIKAPRRESRWRWNIHTVFFLSSKNVLLLLARRFNPLTNLGLHQEDSPRSRDLFSGTAGFLLITN